MRALIAYGTGRYADPWHPFEATSHCIADVLTDDGLDVDLDADVDHAMRSASSFDLVVVNAGDPWRGDDSSDQPPTESIDGLTEAIRSGTGFLVFHAGVASLRDYPDWAALTGAIWLPGISWHPPRGPMTVSAAAEATQAGVGSMEFEVTDELYLRLQHVNELNVIAESTHDGSRHPVAWTRRHGPSRAAVDLLGHGTESFDAQGHRALVSGLARWAVRRPE